MSNLNEIYEYEKYARNLFSMAMIGLQQPTESMQRARIGADNEKSLSKQTDFSSKEKMYYFLHMCNVDLHKNSVQLIFLYG